MKVPTHLAIIMDGNGRWAEQRGLPRTEGHTAGAKSVREIVEECRKLGVKVLTLYSFSTENWTRPQLEVEALMSLLEQYLREEAAELIKNEVRLRGIGETARLPDHVRLLLGEVEKLTADNDGMDLLLALSYGGRAEIVHAVREMATLVKAGELEPEDINEAMLEEYLYTAALPDPGLVIRTSGEMRISNFLLWQIAYSELYVTDIAWPDFRAPQLKEAFQHYAQRNRRFGAVDSSEST